jgi:2'-5' RNA ligase
VTQSVELLLDDATESAVRAQWAALAAAGLPNLGRHTAASNRPHVTMAARGSIDPAREGALTAAVAALPLRVRLGAVACFGRGPFVLVRLVVSSRALLDLQAAVTQVLGPDRATDHHFAPGRWTPHVTLARRLAAGQVGAALAAVVTADVDGYAVACRRWDGDARREWRLAPPATAGSGPESATP